MSSIQASASDQPVILTRGDDGVAHLLLNRPTAGNALDVALASALCESVDIVSQDDRIRVLLVSGQGKRFCVGGDIDSFVGAEDRATYLNELAGLADRAMLRLEGLEVPVVAAVHGAVAGAGLSLMLSADIVIADDSTKFVAAYQGIGFTPDCGLSWLLPRAVGQPRALDFLLSGRSLSASEAQEWGLVSRLAGDGTAIEAARRLAQELASGPKPALGWTRRLARQSWECSRSVTGREEARTIALASGTTDSIVRLEGFSAR